MFLGFFLVQRDISGAEDLTITFEYGGNFFHLACLVLGVI